MNGFSIRQVASGLQKVQQNPAGQRQHVGSGFHDLLQNTLGVQDGVRFSAHALDRLQSRNIQLSSGDMFRLNDAVSRAEDKGSRDSLVLMNNVAFVVSVKNKTVVTAMTDAQMKENVITNIDSTVVA